MYQSSTDARGVHMYRYCFPRETFAHVAARICIFDGVSQNKDGVVYHGFMTVNFRTNLKARNTTWKSSKHGKE